ncbi:MAG TPA: DUF2339 domain-containing protein [Vicinamibacterales bacterium]|nr:DUF2339 domain-containing protein [Vicinamibacterales bacterium]
MSDAPAILLLVVLAGFVFLVAPFLALASWFRVRALEKRLDELTQRLSGATLAPAATVAAAPVAVPAVAQAAAAPAVTAPARPPQPAAKPAAASTGFDLERIVAGRWLHRVGLIAIAVGVALFLKAAIDNDWIGPGGQVALGLLLGTALIASTVWFLKQGYAFFADGITGLGAAILYLSLWAAASYYHLIPPSAAFIAMALVTAGMIAIALGRNSQRVAVLAMIGGFVSPALVSTGQDAQVPLFTYLLLQNTALLVVVYKRDWRFIEIPAFLFTQLYFWIWYDDFYLDSALARTTIFAAAFFAQFAVLPVIRSRRHGAFRVEHGILMLLNVALFLVALRTMMWPDQRWLLTVCTLGLAAFHLIVVQAVPDDQPIPRVVIGGIALTLITIALPMRLSIRSTVIAWAVEAAVLMWTGFRLALWPIRTASFVLFAIVGLWFLSLQSSYVRPVVWNEQFVIGLVTAAAAAAALWFAHSHREAIQPGERLPFGALAVSVNVVILVALTQEIGVFYYAEPEALAIGEGALARELTISLLWTLYASGLVFAGVRASSPLLRWQGLVLFGITTLKVFLSDLSDLSGFYRIMSAIALGVVLLIVSFVYQRKLAAERREGPA